MDFRHGLMSFNDGRSAGFLAPLRIRSAIAAMLAFGPRSRSRVGSDEIAALSAKFPPRGLKA